MHCVSVKCSILKELFQWGIESVKPLNLINNLTVDKSRKIKEIGVSVSDNVYIVGFGKAALGFLSPLAKSFDKQLRKAIFCVPKPTEDELLNKPDLFLVPDQLKMKTIVYHGGRENIPNETVVKASDAIRNLVVSLDKSDTLFVVVTGGGSALLCLPKPGLKVDDIISVTKLLALAGADITELNSVRRRLDLLKGGGLALSAQSSVVVSLILSDVIGDDLATIASGPTVVNQSEVSPISVLEKYHLASQVPERVLFILKTREDVRNESPNKLIYNHVIGNNKTALEAIASASLKIGLKPFILSNRLSGDCSEKSFQLVKCLEFLISYMNKTVPDGNKELKLVQESLSLTEDSLRSLIQTLQIGDYDQGLCLIFGGEMPVSINKPIDTGSLGGRCTHMALEVGLLMGNSIILKDANITCLFGASDGMDGATDCAGAIVFPQLTKEARKFGLIAEDYLENFNSYNFFKAFDNGNFFLNTGMTGTNVMDFILITLDKN